MAKKTFKPKKAKKQRLRKKLSLLLADDHELVRRGIRGMLKARRSWEVVGEARDGFEAVEKAKELRPEVVVLDIDMPGLNGLEAAPRILEAVPEAKILFLTLHESGEMLRRALKAGGQGFVLKSDLAEGLITALKEISSSKLFLTTRASALVMREFLEAGDGEQRAPGNRRKVTAREGQVIRLLTEGKANKQVAEALGIAVRTAEAHRANVMKKLGLQSLAELVQYALQNGLAKKAV